MRRLSRLDGRLGAQPVRRSKLFPRTGRGCRRTRAPSEPFTNELRSTSNLEAPANATLLRVACGGIGWDAVQRISQPPAVDSVTVMVMAPIGIVLDVS